MLIQFSKMQSLGNDFVIIDCITQNLHLQESHLCRLADRHLGIGCDQIITIDPPIQPDADFYYRIFNKNGQEVEQCGNGARCAARFVYERKLMSKTHLIADCLAGRVEFVIEDNHEVTVNMGLPRFLPQEVPFHASEQSLFYPLQVGEQELQLSVISMGNPHAILEVSDSKTANIEQLGPLIAEHPRFPNGTNVHFMEICDPEHIRLRVYERGVGETHACGSGACAAVVAGKLWGRLSSDVTVLFREGSLKIHWKGEGSAVYMRGPATPVFWGKIPLNIYESA
jgi:diaminopimelate epimerase